MDHFFTLFSSYQIGLKKNKKVYKTQADANKSYEIKVAAAAANEKPYHHRDIQASRGRKKPDIDTIESCAQVTKI